MNDCVIDGSWLRNKLASVLAKLKRIAMMRKEGKKKDENGDLSLQEDKLNIELNLLKEIFAHEVDRDL